LFRPFWFPWYDTGQRNSQFATNRLTPFNFIEALAHFLFERDRVLRPVLRIFAQKMQQQIMQYLGRSAQFRQSLEPQTGFHSSDSQWRRGGQKKTHRRA